MHGARYKFGKVIHMVQIFHDTILAFRLRFISNVYIVSLSHKKDFVPRSCIYNPTFGQIQLTLKPYPASMKYKPSLNLALSCQILVPASMCHPSAVTLGLPALCHSSILSRLDLFLSTPSARQLIETSRVKFCQSTALSIVTE
jgi:hypothetical protein